MSDNGPPDSPVDTAVLPVDRISTHRVGHPGSLANPRRLRLHARPDRHQPLPKAG